ncbi:MAG: hypothetical protein ACRDKI_07575 [Solirubrobacterales bacterium]
MTTEEVKRRRRILYGFAIAVVVAIGGVALFSLLNRDDSNKKNQVAAPPLILERFVLLPAPGQSGRGLAELVKRDKNDGLRVLAVKLEPSLDEEVYQLLLVGGHSKPKLLGNEVVGPNGGFIGEAKISPETLHSYRRIELRRVGQGNPPPNKLVLRAAIPR